MARLMADRLSRRFGQQIFVENMPGTAGMLPAEKAARAAPDGYALYLAPAAAISSDRFLYKSVLFDNTAPKIRGSASA